MLQKIMGEASIATTLTFDLELRGNLSRIFYTIDPTKPTRRPDGDQYSFLPPRDVSVEEGVADPRLNVWY
jgi:hypothetical protein